MTHHEVVHILRHARCDRLIDVHIFASPPTTIGLELVDLLLLVRDRHGVGMLGRLHRHVVVRCGREIVGGLVW